MTLFLSDSWLRRGCCKGWEDAESRGRPPLRADLRLKRVFATPSALHLALPVAQGPLIQLRSAARLDREQSHRLTILEAFSSLKVKEVGCMKALGSRLSFPNPPSPAWTGVSVLQAVNLQVNALKARYFSVSNVLKFVDF